MIVVPSTNFTLEASCVSANEEYAIDPYRCQVSCEKYGDPSCPDYAPDGDCYCKNGYARLESNGKCVAVTSLACRSKMPPTKEICDQRNEQLREYLFDEPCPNICEHFKVPCNVRPPNKMIWSPHCACKEGFSRLPNGNCVPINDSECEELWKPSKGKFSEIVCDDCVNVSRVSQSNVFEEETKFMIGVHLVKQLVKG